MSYLMFTVSFIPNVFLGTMFMCQNKSGNSVYLAHGHELGQIIF